LGVGTSVKADPFLFSSDVCDFTVEFPDEPRIVSMIVPAFGEVPEAEISDYRGLMRANCIGSSDFGLSNPIAFYNDRQLLLSTLQDYFVQNGFGNVAYTYKISTIGIRAEARGTKQIAGNWVTYNTIFLVSPRSVMSLTVGNISERFPTAEIISFVDSVSLATHPPGRQSQDSSFLTIKLPYDVSIDVPREWWVLSESMNRMIQTSRDAILDLRGIAVDAGDEAVLIAANSWPPSTYASVRVVRSQSPLNVSDELGKLSEQDLDQLKKSIESELKQSLPLQGLTYLETMGLEMENVSGWPSLNFSYRRSGPNGPVYVQLIEVPRKADLLKINLSYRESGQVVWMPVIARIKQSFQAK
jgi:hypothetical protein